MKQFILSYWWILVVIVIFLIIAKTTISFNPFKISFKEPFTAIGWFLIVIGLSFVIGEAKVKSEHKGYMRGVQELSEDIKKEIKDSNLFSN